MEARPVRRRGNGSNWRDAGQQYLIFLVKHHDGFCLYDSKLTDYKTTGPESAWKHDVMADVARACHETGLKLIVYYSQPDWHHPDYGTANHGRYIDYLHGQIRELLTHYGRIDGFWFDLGGKPSDWDSAKLFRMMRTLQPWLIINNRCGLPGDYDTPEQRLGAFELRRPWETCMTLNTQWSWRPNDEVKSLKQCIDVLVTCAGRNGNLALNTGPMPNGQIEPRQAARFREIGAWLRQYGESIYATRGGPFWGLHSATTRKGNAIYLHVLKWYGDKVLLPPIPKKIVAHSVLTGGAATVRQAPDQVEICVPREDRRALDTIVALRLDGPADEIKPAQILSGSLTFGKKVTVSSVYPGPVGQQYLPAFAVDGDEESGWTFAANLKSAWLEVDLGQLSVFDTAEIHEQLRPDPRLPLAGEARQRVGYHPPWDADRRALHGLILLGHGPVRAIGSARHHDQPPRGRVSRVPVEVRLVAPGEAGEEVFGQDPTFAARLIHLPDKLTGV